MTRLVPRRHLREDVFARWREVAAEAQDSCNTTLEEPAVSPDAQVRQLRRAGQRLAGDAVGEEARFREQSGIRWRRGEPRPSAAHANDHRLVSALPDPHSRYAERGLTMMVKGKVGPRSRRARSQTEPFAQRRGRARRQDHLLMEMVADCADTFAGSTSPARSRSPRGTGVSSCCRKSVNDATRRALFQKAGEACADVFSVFLCFHGFSVVTWKSRFCGNARIHSRGKVRSAQLTEKKYAMHLGLTVLVLPFLLPMSKSVKWINPRTDTLRVD